MAQEVIKVITKQGYSMVLGVGGDGRENIRRDWRGDEDEGIGFEGVVLGYERFYRLDFVSCVE